MTTIVFETEFISAYLHFGTEFRYAHGFENNIQNTIYNFDPEVTRYLYKLTKHISKEVYDKNEIERDQ